MKRFTVPSPNDMKIRILKTCAVAELAPGSKAMQIAKSYQIRVPLVKLPDRQTWAEGRLWYAKMVAVIGAADARAGIVAFAIGLMLDTICAEKALPDLQKLYRDMQGPVEP